MPRVKKSGRETSQQPKTWQQTIVDRIKVGKVVPLISNQVSNDLVLGGHEHVIEAYTAYAEYPLALRQIASIAQFKRGYR